MKIKKTILVGLLLIMCTSQAKADPFIYKIINNSNVDVPMALDYQCMSYPPPDQNKVPAHGEVSGVLGVVSSGWCFFQNTSNVTLRLYPNNHEYRYFIYCSESDACLILEQPGNNKIITVEENGSAGMVFKINP